VLARALQLRVLARGPRALGRFGPSAQQPAAAATRNESDDGRVCTRLHARGTVIDRTACSGAA
jgi:hypothetical protein